MKIINVIIENNFFIDTTGRKGWENVNVFCDIIYENKLFNINVAELLKIHKSYKYDLFSDVRIANKAIDINSDKLKELESMYFEYLKTIYNIDNLSKYLDTIRYEIKQQLEESEYYYKPLFKTKESIENEIKMLQNQLTYFI